MISRLAIMAASAAAIFVAGPAYATNGIGWGPEDRGVRTVIVNERVFTVNRDGEWFPYDPVVIRSADRYWTHRRHVGRNSIDR
jgi:hypothetical protein